MRFEKGSPVVPTLEDQLVERDAILDDLKYNLLKAENNMKLQEDGKRRDTHFAVGDLVYLKMRPYRQKSLAKNLLKNLMQGLMVSSR